MVRLTEENHPPALSARTVLRAAEAVERFLVVHKRKVSKNIRPIYEAKRAREWKERCALDEEERKKKEEALKLFIGGVILWVWRRMMVIGMLTFMIASGVFQPLVTFTVGFVWSTMTVARMLTGSC